MYKWLNDLDFYTVANRFLYSPHPATIACQINNCCLFCYVTARVFGLVCWSQEGVNRDVLGRRLASLPPLMLALGVTGVRCSALYHPTHTHTHTGRKAVLTPLSLLCVRHCFKMSLLLSPNEGQQTEAGIQMGVSSHTATVVHLSWIISYIFPLKIIFF